ncbi:MAG: SMP-30/gluconolactonase/LRE family protein [Candidatus Wenzhouxiangella sp. M2_3B_020]
MSNDTRERYVPHSIRRAGSTGLALAALLLAAGPAFGQAADTAQSEEAEQASEAPPGEQAPEVRSEEQGLAYWFTRAAEAWADEDHEAWVRALEELHRLRPFNHDFMRQLVMAYALTGQTQKAFNQMLVMQQQGLAVDWDAIEEVESLRDYRLYDHLRDLMADAGKPAGEADTVVEIDSIHPMPEAVAHDGKTGRVFVGTVRDGRILVHDPEAGETAVFAEPGDTKGLAAVFDLKVDEDRGHLWAATGSIAQYRNATPSNQGRTALLKLDLETGETLGEYRVTPDGRTHMLGAIALSSDGTVYAADSASPLIYRLAPGAERPSPFLGAPMFVALRGLALSEDESRLYVADYELGLFFFDLEEEGRLYALGVPPTLNLGGIDGLYPWQGHLVAIQNGITPQRILRLELDDSGTRVANIATVAKALPAFDNPTFGTVAGDDLLFLGASHWHLVGPDGRPLERPLPAVPLMRAAIDEAESVILGEDMLERLKQQAAGSGDG